MGIKEKLAEQQAQALRATASLQTNQSQFETQRRAEMQQKWLEADRQYSQQLSTLQSMISLSKVLSILDDAKGAVPNSKWKFRPARGGYLTPSERDQRTYEDLPYPPSQLNLQHIYILETTHTYQRERNIVEVITGKPSEVPFTLGVFNIVLNSVDQSIVVEYGSINSGNPDYRVRITKDKWATSTDPLEDACLIAIQYKPSPPEYHSDVFPIPGPY